MILLLVRHALTEQTGKRLTGWRPGIHLSGSGREQVAALTERLRPVNVGAVYSSPLDRALETAKPIAAAKGLRVRVREELGEVRYGQWEGRPLRALAKTKLWRQVRSRPSLVRFPGGDSLRDTQARAVDVVERIVEEHSKGVVIAVTHGDPIRLLAAHYAGVHLDLYQRLVVAPASVSAFWLGDGGPFVLKLNDTADLSSLNPVGSA
jgi:probable phosphomutase (TIGR03848 family)